MNKFQTMNDNVTTTLGGRRFAPQFIYDIMEGLVQSKANIIISGKTNTGKTTLMNSLADYASQYMTIPEVHVPEEAYRLYQAILSHRTIMTTMHTTSNQMVPGQFSKMTSFTDHQIPNDLEAQFRKNINIGIHMDMMNVNGKTHRYMDEMVEFVPKSTGHPEGINILYSAHMDERGNHSWKLGRPMRKMTKAVYDQKKD